MGVGAAMQACVDHAAAGGAYRCGPVGLRVRIEAPGLGDSLDGLLGQYDAPWGECDLVVDAVVRCRDGLGPAPAEGGYLTTQRLRVDRAGSALLSRGVGGTVMRYDEAEQRVEIGLPADWDAHAVRRSETIEEVEQQFIVVLSRSWQRAGWAPVHAGTLVPPGDARQRCLLVCAPSGTGKTTLVGSMLGLGWRTLGDDKTLMRVGPDGTIEARGLARSFHLHPAMAQWFPRAGDIGRWPRYSRWTEKRSVPVEAVWPGCLMDRAQPSAIVRVERAEWSGGAAPAGGAAVEEMGPPDTLSTLLRQVAIPSDARDARPLTRTLMQAASRLGGVRVRVGEGAVGDGGAMRALSARLQEVLA